MKNRYLLQVCRDKLTDYIMKAIIAPDRYMGEECHIDTQSSNKEVLLLSNAVIKDLDQFEEILIELILTDEEIDTELKSTSNSEIFYISKPLPISRIKKIYTQNEEETKHILKKIESNEKGFIPKHLLEVKSDFNKLTLAKIENLDYIDYSRKIIKYDKLLGMLAFIKNSDYYYADKNRGFKNYASHYFSILNGFNKAIESSENDFLNDLKKESLCEEFVKYLFLNKRLDRDYIQSLIDKETDKSIKKNLNILISDPLEKLNVLKRLKNKGIYFYICMVYINSDKYSNKLANLKGLLNKQVPYENIQKVLAYLGLYYGYELLDAYEEIEIKDKNLQIFLNDNNTMNIKFMLNNRLDYIAIESVYQHVFRSKDINDSFDYLEVDIPTQTKDYKINEQYQYILLNEYYGVEHFEIKHLSQKEQIKYAINKYNDEIYSDTYLYVFYKKYFNNAKDTLFFQKRELLDKIDSSLTKTAKKELLQVLKMDEI